jgi:hypothetical protein
VIPVHSGTSLICRVWKAAAPRGVLPEKRGRRHFTATLSSR